MAVINRLFYLIKRVLRMHVSVQLNVSIKNIFGEKNEQNRHIW